MAFKVGDVVVLKSGGPRMTVVEIDELDCFCQWFDDKNNLASGGFSASSIEIPNEAITFRVGR
ncbi:YodC family protein [Shewanella salipaludis]|uniref:DUF2158 domain-containing protein n=1 Tax=Shewanella salipaludis TaxID=2723052 RepID=A0A972G3Q6_9GAMM|nr:DUF2158 domain-containing protein [Shewanella salipaludis]NMH66931.1 DUF2158 domain-containing protein [Shewanella salipaludis]